MAALWRPLMVKFLILILTKSYFLVLRNNALTFVFFVIVIHELHGIVECGAVIAKSFLLALVAVHFQNMFGKHGFE